MKKGKLPVQEYDLICMYMQTSSGTPLVCDDCGRIIFNIVTIKGKSNGVTYNVGLHCVRRMLNKSIYFDPGTEFEFEMREKEWKQAMNNLNWIKKQSEKDMYSFSVYNYDNKKEFSVILTCKKDVGYMKKGMYGGSTSSMLLDKLPLFSEFLNL